MLTNINRDDVPKVKVDLVNFAFNFLNVVNISKKTKPLVKRLLCRQTSGDFSLTILHNPLFFHENLISSFDGSGDESRFQNTADDKGYNATGNSGGQTQRRHAEGQPCGTGQQNDSVTGQHEGAERPEIP